MIEIGLPDLSTTEGAHALLPCTASGSPEPDITWEKDGHPVSGTEGKFTIQPSGELLVKNSEVRLRPHGAQRGIVGTRGAANVRWAPRLSCSLLSPVQLLATGTWGNSFYCPRAQMGTPKLRVDPVFPRHTGAERQKQGLNLELRDEFPGEGRSPDWGRDAAMTVCPHIAPGWSQAHVDVDLSQRSGRDPRPPSPSSALIRFCHCKVGRSPDGRAAARRAHLGRVTGASVPAAQEARWSSVECTGPAGIL